MRYHAARCHEGRDSQSSSNVLGGFERDFSYQLCNPPKVERHVSLRQNHWLASEFQEMFIFYLEPPKANQFGKWMEMVKQLLFHSKGLGIIIQLKNPIYKWMAINFQVYFPKLDHSDGSRVAWRLKFHHPYQRMGLSLDPPESEG